MLTEGWDLLFAIWERAGGHTVHAFDPRLDSAPEPVTVVGNARALAATPLTISMLPDDETTRALVTEDLRAAAPGHMHIVMGTVGPELVRQLADLPGLTVIDAPVSGSVSMAEAATLTTMVGATAEQFERLRPLLATMTSAQFHAGPVGAGSTAKLGVNAVLAGLSQAVAEGVLLAEAGALELTTFYDILRNSAAGAPYVGYKQQAFLAPETTPVAAPVSLIRKDLGLALELAHRHQLRLPGSQAALSVLDDAIAIGLGPRDMAQIITALRHGHEPLPRAILSPATQAGVHP